MDADAKLRLRGRWNEVRGRVKEAWGSLTDDDLDRAEGRWDQLVGVIQRRTGETVEDIERRLAELLR
ncbi:MAG TPA: CsbD family protein [Actinomycetota bacterium]|nr:CsbD family protein [Actinomycetota bacterium]